MSVDRQEEDVKGPADRWQGVRLAVGADVRAAPPDRCPELMPDDDMGEAEPLRGLVRFLDLRDGECAFVEGEPEAQSIESLRCCGAPVDPAPSRLGARYCRFHRQLFVLQRRRSDGSS